MLGLSVLKPTVLAKGSEVSIGDGTKIDANL